MQCDADRKRSHFIPTVTGGVWPDDITYDRMKKRKVLVLYLVVKFLQRFVQLLGTSWDRTSPRPMVCVFFAQPLSTPDAFDPSTESSHGLLSGSSHHREEPADDDDEPMSDP